MSLTPLHLFLFVHGDPSKGPGVESFVKAVRLNPREKDEAFCKILRNPDLNTIPCVSMWSHWPDSLTPRDLFGLRAQAERFRLLQMRRARSESSLWRELTGEFLKRRRESLEISGRETGWGFHHAPESLAAFNGLTLLQEDFATFVNAEIDLFSPEVWVRSAIKRRFDLQFVLRSED